MTPRTTLEYDFVERAIKERGIPQNISDVFALAHQLYPILTPLRRNNFTAELKKQQQILDANNLEPAENVFYKEISFNAFLKALIYALGWGSNKKVDKAPIGLFSETALLYSRPPQHWKTQTEEQVARRVALRMEKITKQGRRDVAKEISKAGVVEKGTNKKKLVGYARILKGDYNCGFCVMLASRGPVYRKWSAGAKKIVGSTDPRDADIDLFHDGCDCEAMPVFRDNLEEYNREHNPERLNEVWKAMTEDADYSDAARVFSNRWRQLAGIAKEHQIPILDLAEKQYLKRAGDPNLDRNSATFKTAKSNLASALPYIETALDDSGDNAILAGGRWIPFPKAGYFLAASRPQPTLEEEGLVQDGLFLDARAVNTLEKLSKKQVEDAFSLITRFSVKGSLHRRFDPEKNVYRCQIIGKYKRRKIGLSWTLDASQKTLLDVKILFVE